MAEKPKTEFGARKPVAIRPAQPVKRGQVALLLMGTFAVGGGAYALMPGENCEPNRPGMAAPSGLSTDSQCRPRPSSSGSSSHGFWGGSSSRSNFFNADSSSGHASSGTSSDSGSGQVTRGGFGSFAPAFTSHFSGGG